jgi:hypothetical protein
MNDVGHKGYETTMKGFKIIENEPYFIVIKETRWDG